jgi:hypothetical protein
VGELATRPGRGSSLGRSGEGYLDNMCPYNRLIDKRSIFQWPLRGS